MRLSTLALAALLAAAGAAPSRAADPWVIDKSHAIVTFQADHLGFSAVQGQFREFDAKVAFDPKNIEATTLSVTVKAASIDTAWPDRDRHIKSADFLNVAAHPDITFVSTKVTKTSDTTARVEGDLTMIGQTKPVTFEATLNKIGPSPFNPAQTIAGFTVTGEIERAQWGMGFGVGAFATIVPVRIDLEMSPAS